MPATLLSLLLAARNEIYRYIFHYSDWIDPVALAGWLRKGDAEFDLSGFDLSDLEEHYQQEESEDNGKGKDKATRAKFSDFTSKPDWIENRWVNLLFTSRQIYDEAEPILYQSIQFSLSLAFDEQCSFFKGISERARRNIFNIYYFEYLSDGLNNNLYLQQLRSIADYIAHHLPNVQALQLALNKQQVAYRGAGLPKSAWIQQVIKIKNLKALEISFFVAFLNPDAPRSKTLEKKFETLFNFMCSRMVDPMKGHLEVQYRDISSELESMMMTNDPSYEDLLSEEQADTEDGEHTVTGEESEDGIDGIADLRSGDGNGDGSGVEGQEENEEEVAVASGDEDSDRDGDGEVNEDEFFRIMKKTSLF